MHEALERRPFKPVHTAQRRCDVVPLTYERKHAIDAPGNRCSVLSLMSRRPQGRDRSLFEYPSAFPEPGQAQGQHQPQIQLSLKRRPLGRTASGEYWCLARPADPGGDIATPRCVEPCTASRGVSPMVRACELYGAPSQKPPLVTRNCLLCTPAIFEMVGMVVCWTDDKIDGEALLDIGRRAPFELRHTGSSGNSRCGFQGLCKSRSEKPSAHQRGSSGAARVANRVEAPPPRVPSASTAQAQPLKPITKSCK